MSDNPADLARAAGYDLSEDVVKANRKPHGELPKPIQLGPPIVVHGELDQAIAEANAKTRRKRKRSTLADPQGEDLMQIKLLEWARDPATLAYYPDLAGLYHIPNGGKRGGAEAEMFRRLGVLDGVLDLHLPVARTGWHGWWAELKYGDNKPSKSQMTFLYFLDRHGHYAKVWWDDWSAVANNLRDYLDGLLVRS